VQIKGFFEPISSRLCSACTAVAAGARDSSGTPARATGSSVSHTWAVRRYKNTADSTVDGVLHDGDSPRLCRGMRYC
jgi:hypothetical protein